MWLLVILTWLTVYRATRLITTDTFPPCERLRAIVERRYGEDSSITYLISCPWCMSVWLGAIIVVATDVVVGLPVPVLIWASASGVTGFIASVEPD